MESYNRYKIGGSSLNIQIISDEGCVRERELFIIITAVVWLLF